MRESILVGFGHQRVTYKFQVRYSRLTDLHGRIDNKILMGLERSVLRKLAFSASNLPQDLLEVGGRDREFEGCFPRGTVGALAV